MKAIAAVGFAANIIQLVGVAKSVTSTVQDIRRSTTGFSTETEHFRSLAELVCKDIDAVVSHQSPRNAPSNELLKYMDTLRRQVDDFTIESDGLRSNFNAHRHRAPAWNGYEAR